VACAGVPCREARTPRAREQAPKGRLRGALVYCIAAAALVAVLAVAVVGLVGLQTGLPAGNCCEQVRGGLGGARAGGSCGRVHSLRGCPCARPRPGRPPVCAPMHGVAPRADAGLGCAAVGRPAQWVCTSSPWWACDASRIWPTSCGFAAWPNGTASLTCPRGQRVTIQLPNGTAADKSLLSTWCENYCALSPGTAGSGGGSARGPSPSRTSTAPSSRSGVQQR
jgi:hypothetical protein